MSSPLRKLSPRAARLRDALLASYWFVPLLVCLGCGLLAELMLLVDRLVAHRVAPSARLLYVESTDTLRGMLVTVATAALGTAGVVFSLVTVPLAVAASQFGSRLLRNFLRDRFTQIVLGVYLGTFTYCVLVLIAIPFGGKHHVPYIAATGSLVIAFVAVLMLLFFINHIAVSLQAPVVVAEVADELMHTLRYIAPPKEGDGTPDSEDHRARREQVATGGMPILCEKTGYIQAIDYAELAREVRERGGEEARLVMDYRVGAFAQKGTALAFSYPALPAQEQERLADAVRDNVFLGWQRTPTQDPGFAVNQLVEIAVRAMSPAINDPFTAMTCLDRLGAALIEAAKQEPPAGVWRDAGGIVRVYFMPVTFDALTNDAFPLIRQYSRGCAEVLLRMLDAIARVAPFVRRDRDRESLRRHVLQVREEVDEISPALAAVSDRTRVQARCDEVLEILSSGSTALRSEHPGVSATGL